MEGSTDLNDYPVTISQIRSYTDNYTNKSLIYGEGLEYIGICGQGIIDGNGESFQVSDESRKVSLFDSYKARPYIIRIINCKNVVIKDITLNDSPMWVQHYMSCQNVIIEGITVNSRVNHNNDGIDIDACDNVRISNCNIISGDDAIVIKSTIDRPSKNITLNNIRLTFKGGGTLDLVTRKIEEFPEKYPEFAMFGTLPAYGFFCRHVEGLTMENIDLSYELPDYRPAIYLNDVKDSRISDLKASSEAGTESLMVIDNSENVVVRNCGGSESIGALVSLINSSNNIGFINNNFMSKSKLYKSDSTVNTSGIMIK